MSAPLPVSVTPRPGESVESWLEHLADADAVHATQMTWAPVNRRYG